MSTTDDRNDPRLQNIESNGMQEAYLVLSAEERAKGFVRPLRTSYRHTVCGTVTRMGLDIAETYARDPNFYGGTYCMECRQHLPVSEFMWVDDQGRDTGQAVGS
jgi:hypothetical protein